MLQKLLLSVFMVYFCYAQEYTLDINAQESIALDDINHTLEANGQVVINYGPYQSNSHKAFATYTKPNKDIKTLLIEKNVVLVSDQGKALCDKALYEPEEDRLTLTGDNLRVEHQSGFLTSKELIIYHPKALKGEAKGDVYLKAVNEKGEPQELWADEAIVFLQEDHSHNKTKEKKLQVKNFSAKGNIKIIMPGKVATCDEIFYDAKKDEAILKGHVILVSEEKTAQGAYATLDRRLGQFRLFSQDPVNHGAIMPVRILILPIKK